MCSGADYATKTLGGTTTLVIFWDVGPAPKMRKVRSVSELLAEGKAALERLKSGAEAASQTLVALQRILPAELAEHVFSAVLDSDGVLTVVADSAAFATRVRFALGEHGDAIGPALGGTVSRTVVRVRPRPGP